MHILAINHMTITIQRYLHAVIASSLEEGKIRPIHYVDSEVAQDNS